VADTAAPLSRCQSALHVALNACLDAIDAGDLTPDDGQLVIDNVTASMGVVHLAAVNEVQA
jgi:hypothetical protein